MVSQRLVGVRRRVRRFCGKRSSARSSRTQLQAAPGAEASRGPGPRLTPGVATWGGVLSSAILPLMPALDRAFLLDLYRTLCTIRRFEESCIQLYRQGGIRGYLHPYLGEEAIAGGVCAALGPDDYIVSTHRGHGHCLARGGRLDRMFAEITGKATGLLRRPRRIDAHRRRGGGEPGGQRHRRRRHPHRRGRRPSGPPSAARAACASCSPPTAPPATGPSARP